MNKEEMSIVNAIVKTYIEVMGLEKWKSLTEQEQHDMIMILARDLNEMI